MLLFVMEYSKKGSTLLNFFQNSISREYYMNSGICSETKTLCTTVSIEAFYDKAMLHVFEGMSHHV